MVQKDPSPGPKRRGRPRAYDRETALGRATLAFWKAGYAATSLDDLAAATGMNRPSLYAAFGDKHALYMTALERYWEAGVAAMREAFADDRPIREALMAVYDAALGMYFPAKGRPRGCFGIGTATSEAVEDPAIRTLFADGLRRLDEGFARRFAAAQQKGELRPEADPAALAFLASAVLHSIALRARSGTPRPALEAMARKGVEMICGNG
jgi:TetR/AcrR family transcriptional regulator, copper-responsive repressor